MNPKLKLYLKYAAKNAINAMAFALAPIFDHPDHYNFHGWAGIIAIGRIVGWAILSREGLLLIQKLLVWSRTNGNGPVS